MPTDKQRLGFLGSGMASKAAKTALEAKKKKKSRLDSIMGQIRGGRPQKKK